MDFQHLIQVLLESILTGLAAIAVKWVLNKAKLSGLEASAAQQAKLEYFAKQAVLKVEELVAARLRAQPTANVTAADKLRLAVNDVIDRLGVSEDTAADAIHAALPQLGMGAAAPRVVPLELAPAGNK